MNKQSHAKIAMELLNGLRQDCLTEMVFPWDIGWFRYELERAELSLADIGTSDEELHKFHICGLKHQAAVYLRHLRDSTVQESGSYRNILDQLGFLVEKGECTLADCGTNDEEVRGFRVRANRLLLEFARRMHSGLVAAIVRRRCEAEHIFLSEIGSSDGEIDLLMNEVGAR